jgi:hypothetical protein
MATGSIYNGGFFDGRYCPAQQDGRNHTDLSEPRVKDILSILRIILALLGSEDVLDLIVRYEWRGWPHWTHLFGRVQPPFLGSFPALQSRHSYAWTVGRSEVEDSKDVRSVSSALDLGSARLTMDIVVRFRSSMNYH